MTSNIIFVANYNKTLFFKEIADQLQLSSINVFWICVSNFWYKRLLDDGVKAENILYLPRSIIKNKKVGSSVVYDYRLNELIYSDRTLKYETSFAQDYLEAIQEPIRQFIKQNNISFIFGESTWAHELLLNRMCSTETKLDCCYLKPHTIRIPNQRFAFFKDEFESEIYEIEGAKGKDWEFILKKPDHFHINNKKNELSKRLLNMFRNVSLAFSREKHDREDPTQRLSRLRFFSAKLISEFNYYIYRGFVKTVKENNLPKRFWVYYLHMQPEASIDVIGRYFEDQYANIVRLTKMLPDGCYLLVKEHSNGIGNRPYSFYKKVRGLNRVRLIDEKIDSFTLMEQAEKTVTVSGTVAYEASLLNKPCFVFSKVFFSALPSIETIGFDQKNSKSIRDFKRYIYKHSFQGIISDPILNDPKCVAPENIKLVSDAFLTVIRK